MVAIGQLVDGMPELKKLMETDPRLLVRWLLLVYMCKYSS